MEASAKIIFGHIASAINVLHNEMSCVHRDIKLDNIVFATRDKMAKLCDFTVSRIVGDDEFMFDSEGTPAFTAPECHVVEKEGYKPKPTDIWSLGISIFAYISGTVPFYA